MQPEWLGDPENRWRGRMLERQHVEFLVNNKLYTEEMQKDFKKLVFWRNLAWVSPLLGAVLALGVINPAFVGRQSILLRKVVIAVSSYYSYFMFQNLYRNEQYVLRMKYYDHYAPHVRQYLSTKDARYLMLNDNSFYSYDSITKKSIF